MRKRENNTAPPAATPLPNRSPGKKIYERRSKMTRHEMETILKDSPTALAVNLFVDSKGYLLYWSDQHREMDCLEMSLITDVRTGPYARVPKDPRLRESLKIGPQDSPLPNKMLTICYGSDLTNISFINFSCLSTEIAKEWASEIFRCCHTSRSSLTMGPLNHLERSFLRLSLIRDADGKIPVKNIIKMFTKNNNEDKKKVLNALEASKLPNNQTDSLGSLTFDEYFIFYQNLCFRMDVSDVFYSLRSVTGGAYMSPEQLMEFLNTEQRDSRLNELLHPFCTLEKSYNLISKYEPNPELSCQGKMSRQGFLKFLLSSDNNVVSRLHSTVNQNMNQPLSHYFINSSHNTYLTGHQLTSRSSVEMYRQSLLAGCRCIEIDCWDGGDEEPVVTHGFTMCTEIPLKDVLESIAEAAFKVSDWPIILSFENHCSPKQQAKIAQYCQTIFADHLLHDPLSGHPLEPGTPLPSPETLKRKILVKNKKHHPHKGQQVSSPSPPQDRKRLKKSTSSQSKDSTPSSPIPSTSLNLFFPNAEHGIPTAPLSIQSSPRNESESDSEVEGESEALMRLPDKFKTNLKTANAEKGTAGQEVSAVSEISNLVIYLQPARFISFGVSEKKDRSYECSSFVESQALVLLNAFPVEFVNYNKTQISRIYPRGTRVDSSNFIPQLFWNSGCQLVALNFQTLDLAMQLNLGAFEFNGRCGYLVKPGPLTLKDRHFDPFADRTIDGIVPATLIVKVISGQFLSDKKAGTYVAVDLFGLPFDTVRSKFRTRVCTANCINPVYNEEPFVFKQIIMPHLAYLRLAVYQENGTTILGQRVLPIEYVRPGYRHISLYNERCQPQGMASLFVHITLKDYIPESHAEIAAALTNPIAYQSQFETMERHANQLAVLEDFEYAPTDSFPEDQNQFQVSQLCSPSSSSDMTTQMALVSSSYPPSYKLRRCTLESQKGSTFTAASTDKPMRAATLNTLKSFSSETNLTFVSDVDSKYSGLHISSSMLVTSQRYRLNKHSLQLTEVDTLAPVTLAALQRNKHHLKVIAKLDKEFNSIKKKHQKELCQRFAQHQQEIKRLNKELKNKESQQESTLCQLKQAKDHQSSDLIHLCYEQEMVELRYKTNREQRVYESLCRVIEDNREMQLIELEKRHTKGVGSLKKKLDTHIWEELKQLKDKHKDKKELSRVRKESMQKNIDSGVRERLKLVEIYEKHLKLVTTMHDQLLQQLSGDRDKVEQELKLSFKKKFSNTGLSQKKSPSSETQNTIRTSFDISQFKVLEETRV